MGDLSSKKTTRNPEGPIVFDVRWTVERITRSGVCSVRKEFWGRNFETRRQRDSRLVSLTPNSRFTPSMIPKRDPNCASMNGGGTSRPLPIKAARGTTPNFLRRRSSKTRSGGRSEAEGGQQGRREDLSRRCVGVPRRSGPKERGIGGWTRRNRTSKGHGTAWKVGFLTELAADWRGRFLGEWGVRSSGTPPSPTSGPWDSEPPRIEGAAFQFAEGGRAFPTRGIGAGGQARTRGA